MLNDMQGIDCMVVVVVTFQLLYITQGQLSCSNTKKSMSHMFVNLYIHYRTSKSPGHSVILLPYYYSLFWYTICCCALHILVLRQHQNEEGRVKRHVSAAFRQFQSEKL